MATQARLRANAKYQKKAYDQIRLAVKKGWRDKVKQAADEVHESMTQYIVKATESRMNDKISR